MNYYSYNARIDDKSPVTYIRFLHASPDASNIDVYANDNLVLKNISYRNFSEYYKALPGNYNISIYKAGHKDSPLLNTVIHADDDMVYTVAITNNAANIKCDLIPDTKKATDPNKVFIRVIHLSPDLMDVDVSFNGGMTAIDLEFSECTEYFTLKPETYTIKVNEAGTSNTVLTVPNMHLKAGKYYAAYIIGYSEHSPGLQILLPLEGTTYLKF